MRPNLIERMEELISTLETAMQHIADNDRHGSTEYMDLEHAYGVAGEIMTMLDGR